MDGVERKRVLGVCEYCNKKMREWKGKRSDFKGRKNHLTCWIKKQDALNIEIMLDSIKAKGLAL